MQGVEKLRFLMLLARAPQFLPFTDGFTRGDGGLGAPWSGSTWTIASNEAINTPTGTEKISDGDMELAGTAQWPRDLPDTISSASGAASKVLSLFSRSELLHEPTIARVDEEVCVGCGQCVSVCAYNAVEVDPRRRVAVVNPAVCEGCGACAATCPSKAMQHKNWTPAQFFEMIHAATAEYA